MGRSACRAKARNSREMHSLAMLAPAYSGSSGRPASPSRSGIATVKPASTRRRAKAALVGVMPGTSCMNSTPGPSPAR